MTNFNLVVSWERQHGCRTGLWPIHVPMFASDKCSWTYTSPRNVVCFAGTCTWLLLLTAVMHWYNVVMDFFPWRKILNQDFMLHGSVHWPLILVKSFCTISGKRHQSMYPTLCLTVGMVFFESYSAFLKPKSPILISSDHSTFFQALSESFICSCKSRVTLQPLEEQFYQNSVFPSEYLFTTT